MCLNILLSSGSGALLRWTWIGQEGWGWGPESGPDLHYQCLLIIKFSDHLKLNSYPLTQVFDQLL